jgi:hypothetical protein
MFIGSTNYCYRSIIYIAFLLNSEDFWQNSFFFYTYWFLVNFAIVPITLMISGLVFFHSLLLINNLTTIDVMGGLKLGITIFPCAPNKFASKINIFNLGIFANIRNFFS